MAYFQGQGLLGPACGQFSMSIAPPLLAHLLSHRVDTETRRFLGGLLNATLGNAPEIIISGFALHKGLVELVKSSLTGSIIGNPLPATTQIVVPPGKRMTPKSEAA